MGHSITPRNVSNRTRTKLIYPAVLLLILILSTSLITPLKPLTLGLLRLPLVLVKGVAREIGGILFYHRNLVYNERLRIQLALSQQKLSGLEEERLESARLRQLLQLKERLPFKVMPARVIARAPEQWSSVVVIDRGSASGVESGLAVINYNGLVGRIVEVYPSTSKVMLITDPTFSVSALVQRSRQEGLVCGTLGDTLLMRYLPKDADIKAQDTIVTSGLSQAYPKGITIGTVTETNDEFLGMSRVATVRPAASLASIEEVLVIIHE